jgi:hypothetical protein
MCGNWRCPPHRRTIRVGPVCAAVREWVSVSGDTMDDRYNLQRFVDAHNGIFDQVCAQLQVDRKTGHWMWFIFPQI